MHDLLVGRSHHALPIDLDDAVAHSDAASLCDAPSHEAADLSTHRPVSLQMPTMWTCAPTWDLLPNPWPPFPAIQEAASASRCLWNWGTVKCTANAGAGCLSDSCTLLLIRGEGSSRSRGATGGHACLQAPAAACGGRWAQGWNRRDAGGSGEFYLDVSTTGFCKPGPHVWGSQGSAHSLALPIGSLPSWD